MSCNHSNKEQIVAFCDDTDWTIFLPFQQTFQRCFKVVVRLIWRHDVRQRQINVETMLCFSTLKFTTLNNVETMLLFSTSSFTTLINFETTLWIWSFANDWKQLFELKVGLSPSKKIPFYLPQWKAFKNEEKCFLFDLKSFFRSQDI